MQYQPLSFTFIYQLYNVNVGRTKNNTSVFIDTFLVRTFDLTQVIDNTKLYNNALNLCNIHNIFYILIGLGSLSLIYLIYFDCYPI